MAVEDLDDILERAFWHFDALHKAHYRDVDPKLAGPMVEREAFKCTVRDVVLDALGVKYERASPRTGPSCTGFRGVFTCEHCNRSRAEHNMSDTKGGTDA